MKKILGIEFTKKDIPNLLLIIFSAFIYSCGMNSFVSSGNLFPGGFAGISRLLSKILQDFSGISLSFSTIYFTLNIATTLLIWKRIGHKFIIYSFLWFSMTSLFTSVLKLPTVTSDALLICVFGGLISGFSVGLALRANASSGGTDFIAIDLSQRLHRPVWNYIFAVNACVLLTAGYLYGWNQALYSIIFQYVSKEVVSTMHVKYKLSTLQVVTDRPDEICKAVFSHVRHGITILPCTGAYSKTEHSMLMISVNNDQLHEVEKCILAADPRAFITIHAVERIIGNYYQKPIE